MALYLDLSARFGPGRARLLWLGGSWLLLLGLTLALGSLLMAAGGDGPAFDGNVSEAIAGARDPVVTEVLRIATRAGDALTLVALTAVLGLAWRAHRGDWSVLEVLATAYLGAAVLYNVAKPWVGRSRPGLPLVIIEASGQAFPSGHTTGAAAFYTALALLVGIGSTRRLTLAVRIAAPVIVALVAYSRIYLGAHWLTDVIVGGVVGGIWGVISVVPVVSVVPGLRQPWDRS